MSEFKRCDVCNRALKSPPSCAVGACPSKMPVRPERAPNPYADKNERSGS